MDWATLMQMFGGAGGAGAAAGAGGMAEVLGGAGAAAAPMMVDPSMAAGQAFAAPAAPAMGSGMYGVDSVAPGVMQMGQAGPMGQGPIAQGTGPLLAQGIPVTDDTLSKLANAPIDPKLLMEMLKQGQGDGGGGRTKTVGGGGASSVGQMRQLEMGQPGPRNSLSQLLGK